MNILSSLLEIKLFNEVSLAKLVYEVLSDEHREFTPRGRQAEITYKKFQSSFYTMCAIKLIAKIY